MTGIRIGSNEPEIETLVDKCQSTTSKGREMPKLDIGMRVLYDKNPNSTKIKCPQWCKGTVKNRGNQCKSHIMADDNDRMITRSRHHIKAYMTRLGRVSKAPKGLVETL